jgi:hypothetical protein
VRNAIYLALTPILLFVGWAFLSNAFVESAGPSGGVGGVLVAVGGLLMIPLGVAVGWHYRHRSMRHLIVTPVVLFFGWRFFAVLRLWATGQLPDGTGIVVVRLSALLIIPLGVAVGWRYRHRSLRVAAHLILTPVVLFFGWFVFWALLAWLTGQDWMISGLGGMTATIVGYLMIPLGIVLGWLRYRHVSRSTATPQTAI